MRVVGRRYAPAALIRREREPVPIAQEACWVTGPLWTAAKNLPTPGFDPEPSSPYFSRYTNYAISTHRPAVYSWYQLGQPTVSIVRIYPVRRTWPLFFVSHMSE